MSFSFACGIAIYIVLPEEPFWPLLMLVLAAGVVASVWARGLSTLGQVTVLLVAVWAGLAFASLRTALVDGPRLAEEMNVTLTGVVLDRQERSGRTRLVLGVETIEGYPRDEVAFPARVRVSIPEGSQAVVGNVVELRARLFPPTGPAVPDGYDYSFHAYFSKIGATGFAYGEPSVLPSDGVPLLVRANALVEELRAHLAARIRSSLPEGQETALVVALLVGDRSGIDEAQEEDLRAAGLAHILAISGLHMALFAGGAYAAALFGLALFPIVSLRWPIHKIAAVTALFAAVFYLLISGASVATQRSFLMIALVFLGILAGRRGLTLRSVALAGLFLLLIAPERLFSPGFQMSFAAVICLVAVYEAWRNRKDPFQRRRRISASVTHRLTQSLIRWTAGIFVTALVAGLATGIIAAHHFGRVAPFGLLGNMLGMPVFTLLVMPMGVLALVLMPFGLATLPLKAMSFGLSLLTDISAFVAGLDGGAGAIGRLTTLEMLAFTTALFVALLLHAWWRLSAVAPLALGLLLIQITPPPDIQIASSGARIAARDEIGMLRWAGRRQGFVTDIWFQTEGVFEGAIKSRKMKSPQLMCDPDGCVVRSYPRRSDQTEPDGQGEPFLIALPKTQEALLQDCNFADLIVSDLIVSGSCGSALVLDQSVRQRRGAVSVWLSKTAPSGESSTLTEATVRSDQEAPATVRIDAIEFAIKEAPRPWHKEGNVTRASLRKDVETAQNR